MRTRAWLDENQSNQKILLSAAPSARERPFSFDCDRGKVRMRGGPLHRPARRLVGLHHMTTKISKEDEAAAMARVGVHSCSSWLSLSAVHMTGTMPTGRVQAPPQAILPLEGSWEPIVRLDHDRCPHRSILHGLVRIKGQGGLFCSSCC